MSLKLPGIGKPFTQYSWTSDIQDGNVYVDILHLQGTTRIELRPDDVWPDASAIKSEIDKYLTDGQKHNAYEISEGSERSYIDFNPLGRFTGRLL